MTKTLETSTIDYELTSSAYDIVKAAYASARKRGDSPNSADLLNGLLSTADVNMTVGAVIQPFNIAPYEVDLNEKYVSIENLLYDARGQAECSLPSRGMHIIVASEHLLLSLLKQHDPVGELLTGRGLYLAAVRERFIRLRREANTAPLPVVG